MRPFYVMETCQPAPEVVDVQYKHIECSICGLRPTARVGSTGVRFVQEDGHMAWSSPIYLVRA